MSIAETSVPPQRHLASEPQHTTHGGQKLRSLRQAAKLSLADLAAQLEVDFEKHLDTRHINRIETGSIKKPQAETLEAILTGLNASYGDRRAVLEAFGYRIAMTLPTEDEVAAAVRLAEYDLQDATYPVCLVDHGQHIWAWNRYTPRLVGLHPDDPATRRFAGLTLFDITFNPAFETRLLIANPEEYLPAMLQYIKVGTYQFHSQPWYEDMIAKASAFPGFRALWDSLPADEPRSAVQVKMTNATILQFRLSSTELIFDPRFVILHFTPFGARTLHACGKWAEEEGTV